MNTSSTFLSISPGLVCKNISETLRYFEEKLGFSKTFINQDDGNDPVYAIVCRDKISIHLSLEREGQMAGHSNCHFLVTDVEELYKNLINNETNVVYHDFESGIYDLKTFTIKDIDGNHLTFAEEI